MLLGLFADLFKAEYDQYSCDDDDDGAEKDLKDKLYRKRKNISFA